MGDMANDFLEDVMEAEVQECEVCNGGPGWHFAGCSEAE